MMRMHVLACLLLALPVVHGLSRADCTNFNMNSQEKRILELLCTRNAVINNQIVFGHPSDSKKFLICSDMGVGCSGTCANGANFDKVRNTCGSAAITCTLPSGADTSVPTQPLGATFQNPCSSAGSKTCLLINHSMKNRFIICERSTTQVPMVGQCLAGFEFNFASQTCVKVKEQITTCNNGINPCKPIPITEKVISADRLYFGCSDDPTKFIHCDRWGKMTVKQCKNKTVWSQTALACASD